MPSTAQDTATDRGRTRVVFFSTQPYDRRFFTRINDERFADDGFDLVFSRDRLTVESTALAAGADAVCVFVNDDVSAPVVEALREAGVRTVLLRCAGFNNVDLDAAKAAGIAVARVPAYSPEAVAEHAVTMLLTLNRKTHRAYNRVREGNFALDGLLGFTLHGKVAGVVGTGRIGVCAARILHGFGMQVLGSDPYRNPEFEKVGTYVEPDELFERSDVITLHSPLTADTYHLIGKPALDKMKDGVFLVNTSRGALVDTKQAIKALKSGKLGGLAIDVYEQEEALFFHDRSHSFIPDDVFARLSTFPNVLITGHQAFFTGEALDQISDVALSNLRALVRGEDCPHLV
jgi:D-lactate dehydrogenase